MAHNPFEEIDSRLKAIEVLLQKLINQPQAQIQEADDLGGIELAQKVTGLKKATIYSHVHYKKIPHFKKGSKLYFSKQDLQNWITTEKVNETINKSILQKPLFPKFKNKY